MKAWWNPMEFKRKAVMQVHFFKFSTSFYCIDVQWCSNFQNSYTLGWIHSRFQGRGKLKQRWSTMVYLQKLPILLWCFLRSRSKNIILYKQNNQTHTQRHFSFDCIFSITGIENSVIGACLASGHGYRWHGKHFTNPTNIPNGGL